MFFIDKKLVNVERFNDGTIDLRLGIHHGKGEKRVEWYYDNDGELFTLVCIAGKLRELGYKITLYLPYVPNARMDRVKDDDDVFALKFFAKILNGLGFERVTVLDPHSNVTGALIENVEVKWPTKYIERAIERIGGEVFIFYPDEGARKRYADLLNMPYAFGSKDRGWKTHEISGLKIMGDVQQVKDNNILMIDDICATGSTFLHAAEELKKLGAKDIYLYATHTEHTVLERDLLKGDAIKKLFTTGSLARPRHEKIEVVGVSRHSGKVKSG